MSSPISERAPVNCPLCTNQILQPNHRGGIEIDVCPNCRGIWLDRGELDKLMADAAPAPAPRSKEKRSDAERRSDPKSRDKGSKDKGKKKRKKSLGERLGDVLEEALDF